MKFKSPTFEEGFGWLSLEHSCFIKPWSRLVSRIGKRPSVIIVSILLVLGFIDAWAGRRSYVAGDSISYVDMANELAQGNLSYAVNGHFSPLYPIILSLFIRPFQHDALLEFSVVRVINFSLFVVALLAFQGFLRRFLDQTYGQLASPPAMSRSQFTVASYVIFAWSTFGLTIVSRVNPDMCVVALTLAAAAILLSFKDGHVSHKHFALFGAVLGLGYLAKTIFFPLSVVFLVVTAFEPNIWAVRSRLLTSLATFLLIASPLIATLSIKYNHLTFGESGRLSYWTEVLRENRESPAYVHWQGVPPESGIPEHPTRKIFNNPDVYEFASPIISTYPPWFGTTYWNAGANVHFDLRKQAIAIAGNLEKLAKLLWFMGPVLVALIAYRCRVFSSSLNYFRSLWLIGIANVGIYLLVLIDGRYLAGCLPLLVIVLLAAVRAPNSGRTLGTALLVIIIAGVGLQCVPRLFQAAELTVLTHGDVRDERWFVAEEFDRLGIQPGAPVAAIDYQRGQSYWPPALISDWARLANVRVVCEVVQTADERTQFWEVSADRQALVLQVIRGTGARIVVASGVPDGVSTSGWTQIGNSSFFYKLL